MKNLVAALFLLMGITLSAQTTVTGTVVDQAGTPVPSANVVVVGLALN